VGGDNSAGGVGPQTEGASTGGLVGAPTRILFNPFTGLPANNSAYFNRMRDPNNPFTSGSTQIINGSQFVNNGFNAQISLFSGVIGNDLPRNIETVFDPLTRKTRLLVSTSLGVYTAVDAANPLPTQGIYANAQSLARAGQRVSVNGTVFDSIGTAISVSGNRSSNLALAEVTQTGLQPSELAADVAGLYNRLLRDALGTPLPPNQQNSQANQWIYSVTDQAYLNADGSILRSASANYGQDRWNGEVNTFGYLRYAGNTESWVYTGHVETDPQGSGTIYQYRPAPFARTAGAAQVNPQGDSTDIFSVTLPGFAPIGRSNGLFNVSLGDSATTGIWATTAPVEFAVNTADASGIVIGSPVGGRVFLTTDQGVNWFNINGAADFNGSQGVALAFGGRIATPPGNPPSGANDFIYNGTAQGRIWVTLNGGGTWTDISAGLPPGGGPIRKLIPNPRGGTYEAYAITGSGVFYKADARTAAAWQNVTGNVFNITRNVFGEPTVVPLLNQLSALAVDWRYAQPRLYVGGDSGVFRSTDRGATWALYPAMATNPGAVDGGYLPTVTVTDLDLVYGNLNPSGVPDQTTSRNVLVASTYGRGLYAIRLDPATVPGGAGTLGTSGPWVNTAPLTAPAAATGLAGITLNFGVPANPVKVDQTTLNPTNLLIVAPGGSYVPYTVTDISALAANGIDSLANSFRLNFTPPATGTYQLLLSTGVRDTSGRAMNQDRDVTNGEIPQDWFTTTYPITVNQAPTVSPVANVGLPVNTASGALPFTVGDAETAAGTLTVTRTTSNATLLPLGNIVLGGSGANRTVTVTPAAGQTGVAIVTLTVTDGGGRQTSTTFNVSVAAAAVPFADDFNRPDAPNLGGQWTIRAGTIEESLNAALATSTPALATLTDVSQLNSTAQATVSLSSAGTNGSSGLVARFAGTGAAPTNYLGLVQQLNGVVTARILRQVNGVTTTLSASAAIPFAPQYVLRFDVVNDALKLFVNGTLTTFAYDPVLTAAGGTGIRFTSGNRLDDYTDADVTLLPVTLPAVPGTTVTDPFTQADGTQLSRSWRDRFGNLSVTANAAVGRAGLNLSTYNTPAATNAGAQANVAFTAANQTVGLVTRYAGTPASPLTNFYWGAISSQGNGQLYAAIYKFNASGTATQLASVGLAGTGGLLRFEADGGALKLFLNGNLILSGFDGAPLAAGVAGLLSARGGSADNFVAFALGTTAALPFSDAFNAGNVGNQLSSVWTQRAGSFDLTANTAAATGTGGNTATLNGVNAADVVVTGTFKTPSNLEVATGLVARYSGVGERNFYWAALNPFGNGVPGYSAQIWKVVNGVATVLNANAFPLSAGTNPSTTNAVLRFEVVGSSLKLYLNDQLASYATDTSLTTGSVGVRSVAGSQIDDFSAAVFAQQTPTLPFADAFASNPPRNTLSANWQERSGYFNVAGGVATGNEVTQGNTATLNGVSAADVVVTATFRTPTGTEAAAGLVARYTGTNGTGDNNFYWAALNPFGGGTPGYSAQIWKVVNGVATVLNANAFPLSAGTNPSTTNAVLRFEVVGASLKLFLNDQLASYAYDTSLTTGGVGIRTAAGGSVAAFSAVVRPSLTPTLPFADTFNAGLNPQNALSANWREQSGYFGVGSGRAVGGDASVANLATLNGVAAANATIDATFFFTGANQVGGLVGRYSGTNGTGETNLYLATVVTLTGGDLQLLLMKNVGGSYSVLSSSVLTGYFAGGNFAATNPLLQFKLLGSQLTLSVDGVQQLTATDTSLATGSVGVRQTQGVAADGFAVTSP